MIHTKFGKDSIGFASHLEAASMNGATERPQDHGSEPSHPPIRNAMPQESSKPTGAPLSTESEDKPVDERFTNGQRLSPEALFDRVAQGISTPLREEDLYPGWRLHLKATHPQQNVHRFYTVRIDHNLFGEWSLFVSYGRVGTHGQCTSLHCTTRAHLLHQLQQILRKRAAAPKRIGCAYGPVAMPTIH